MRFSSSSMTSVGGSRSSNERDHHSGAREEAVIGVERRRGAGKPAHSRAAASRSTPPRHKTPRIVSTSVKGARMQATPPKVAERITSILKRFQPILTSAKARDVNEADTVVIVVDLLAELYGYDK